jgi:hypothetical protein
MPLRPNSLHHSTFLVRYSAVLKNHPGSPCYFTKLKRVDPRWSIFPFKLFLCAPPCRSVPVVPPHFIIRNSLFYCSIFFQILHVALPPWFLPSDYRLPTPDSHLTPPPPSHAPSSCFPAVEQHTAPCQRPPGC